MIEKMVQLFKCLSDENRLRILNLLRDGPLCGCHLIGILGLKQVTISKHLNYMKKQGLVESRRHGNWMIYRLATPPHPLLMENLQSLERYSSRTLPFKADHRKRSLVLKRMQKQNIECPQAVFE